MYPQQVYGLCKSRLTLYHTHKLQYFLLNIYNMITSDHYSVGHYPNTALFNNPKKNSLAEGSGLSSLGRIMLKSQGLCGGGVPLFLAIFPNGLLNDFRLPRRPLMVRAALLRRRRGCDGVAAATEMRRPAPSRSFCASRLDATR